jgi:hypothetical protein
MNLFLLSLAKEGSPPYSVMTPQVFPWVPLEVPPSPLLLKVIYYNYGSF